MGEDKMKALKELLKLLANDPELADRITITIKPSKLSESEPRKEPKNK